MLPNAYLYFQDGCKNQGLDSRTWGLRQIHILPESLERMLKRYLGQRGKQLGFAKLDLSSYRRNHGGYQPMKGGP